jgi:hypothetical protein
VSDLARALMVTHLREAIARSEGLGAIILVVDGLQWGRDYARRGWQAYGDLGPVDFFITDKEIEGT